MSKDFFITLGDGSRRTVANLSNGRATDFHQATRMVEHASGLASGLGEDESGAHEIDGEAWVAFFNAYWHSGANRYLLKWAGIAGGIVEAVTGQPHQWLGTLGYALPVQHNGIPKSERAAIEAKRERGEATIVREEKEPRDENAASST